MRAGKQAVAMNRDDGMLGKNGIGTCSSNAMWLRAICVRQKTSASE